MPKVEQFQLSEDERDILTGDPDRQNEAHLLGAYDYLAQDNLSARYSIISGLIEQYNCASILDIGCYIGGLRGVLNKSRIYHGIDISQDAISDAHATYANYSNTSFSVGDIRKDSLPLLSYECIVWAGIGFGISNSENKSFTDLFQRVWELGDNHGILIFECVASYDWIRSHIEKFANVINVIHVTHALATLHNKRTIFVAQKKLNI